jgi:hypothetical protein
MAVTVTSSMGDFGVFTENESVPSSTSGEEYYGSLMEITATEKDSYLVGNKRANTFNIVGGASNVLTGGLNADTFIFQSGGGIITDFGVGAANTNTGKKYATTTTMSNYNRTNPTSYAEGSDVLKVNGTVQEVVVKAYTTAAEKTQQTFYAYVNYTDSTTGEANTIRLDNIVKTLTNKDYKANETVAKTLKIWDTSTGSSAQLSSTAIGNLLTDTVSSDYQDNVTALDALLKPTATGSLTANGDKDFNGSLYLIYGNNGNPEDDNEYSNDDHNKN